MRKYNPLNILLVLYSTISVLINSIIFFLNTYRISGRKSKKSVFTETGVSPRMTKTPYKTPQTSIKVAKNAWGHVTTCDTWSQVTGSSLSKKWSWILRFVFEDVISKWLKSLRYSIPLTKILRAQTGTWKFWPSPPSNHDLRTNGEKWVWQR